MIGKNFYFFNISQQTDKIPQPAKIIIIIRNSRNKNVPYPMLETFYHSELTSYGLQDRLRKAGRGNECDALHRTLTYHRDHGYGMDAYTVGPTLGAGVPALLDGDHFVYPLCYKEAEVLDMGPLRFTVRQEAHTGLLVILGLFVVWVVASVIAGA